MDRKRTATAIVLALGLHAAVFFVSDLLLTGREEIHPAARIRVGLRTDPVSAARRDLSPASAASSVPDSASFAEESSDPPGGHEDAAFPAQGPQPEPGSVETFLSKGAESGSPAGAGTAGIPSSSGADAPGRFAAVRTTEPIPAEPVVPDYPVLALRLGLEGAVVLEVSVTAEGSPSNCRIVESEAHEILEKAAVEAVMAAVFHPATVDGVPVTDVLRIRIVFEIEA